MISSRSSSVLTNTSPRVMRTVNDRHRRRHQSGQGGDVYVHRDASARECERLYEFQSVQSQGYSRGERGDGEPDVDVLAARRFDIRRERIVAFTFANGEAFGDEQPPRQYWMGWDDDVVTVSLTLPNPPSGNGAAAVHDRKSPARRDAHRPLQRPSVYGQHDSNGRRRVVGFRRWKPPCGRSFSSA